jgi:hypothetical protein
VTAGARPGTIALVEWTFVYLMVGLKLPIAALLWIVWWAIRQTPETAEERRGDDGGIKDRRPRHPRIPPRLGPRRRGPHGAPSPPAPPRIRTSAARARLLEH